MFPFGTVHQICTILTTVTETLKILNYIFSRSDQQIQQHCSSRFHIQYIFCKGVRK